MASLADANRAYFDKMSETIRQDLTKAQWIAAMNDKVTSFVQSHIDWIAIPSTTTNDHNREVRLLDYACGDGVLSRVLHPYVTDTVGIDVSPLTVSSYNTRNASLTPPHPIHAVVGSILEKSDPNPSALSSPEFFNFHIASVGLAFHHFEDPVYAAECLRKRLRPGGVLMLTDFLKGGDILVGDDGKVVEGSEGDHSSYIHHAHDHGHKGHEGHDHGHAHHHHHHHQACEHDHHNPAEKEQIAKQMRSSIVVTAFSIQEVKDFLAKAGFVDVEVKIMEEKVFMDFGKKMVRAVLVARGRNPGDAKDELRAVRMADHSKSFSDCLEKCWMSIYRTRSFKR